MPDDSAYKAVQVIKWIVQNAETKQEAHDILATLQGGDVHGILRDIAGYDGLPGGGVNNK